MFLKSGLIEKPLDYSLDGGGGVKRGKTQAARKIQTQEKERGGEVTAESEATTVLAISL